MYTLVGRSSETEVIASAIAALANGRGRVLLIAGEPGIGKSTLARVTAEQAGNADIETYWGFAWEAGGAPAYWPWTQILRSLGKEDLITDDESALALGAEQARFQLLEKVRAAVEKMAHRKPMVLVLEDLHAADSDTLHLLHYIARHVTTMPVLLVGTFREAEARASAAMEPLWRTARDATVLRPDHLGESDVRDYLAARGNTASESQIENLLETTSGNPLFLTELVDMLMRRESGVETQLPDSVQQVIRQHMALLPEDTGDLLTRAAVIGREFSIEQIATTADKVEPAVTMGVVRPLGDGRYRFSHVLHRDVLYQDMSTPDRSVLHLRYAKQLEERIESANEDRWAELAQHLIAAGAEHRADAVAAWQEAAAKARRRLAFDDAARLLQTAVAALGDGPRFEPADRVALLVECGGAMLQAGRIEEGRGFCCDAFNIAAALADPQLMSLASLTYGKATVISNVDRMHVDKLQQSLEELPNEDASMRPRVLGRLAAALQPAVDPTGPMDMAREAIAMARGSEDEQVIYDVLRFAISALMDFAGPAERMSINREVGELAEKIGDVPTQFRSALRLMIDAGELGDRKAHNDAIDACDAIARRIALPHYQWRAASARALLATIEGRFADASALLDESETFACAIDSLEAKMTLPMQRFAILCEWNSDRAMSFADIEAQIETAFDAGMRDAEFFVRPYFAAFTNTDADSARKILLNKPVIERAFSGGDRFSILAVGRTAMLAGDRELVERSFAALRVHERECGSLGLLGGYWCGPIAYELGKLAQWLDRDDAQSFFDVSLELAQRMQSQPFVARTLLARGGHDREARQMMADLSMRPTRIAPTEATQIPASAATHSARLVLEADGDVWRVTCGSQSAMIKNSKGMEMIARLVSQPDQEIHVLDLSGAAAAPDTGDAGPVLDDQARRDYQARVVELQEELEEAETLGDTGRADSARDELDFITRELSQAFGLGGRKRRAGSAAERARVNVRRRIKDAIKRIDEQLPDAGRYLENAIKTGTYCRYSPL
jgi:DNA polymerase III delta prime subunit